LRQRRELRDLASVDELRGQDLRRGQIVNDGGDVDLRKVGEVAAQDLHVAGFLEVIQLVVQRQLRLLDRPAQVHLPPDLSVLFERLRDVGQRVQLLVDFLTYFRPLHFDYHLPAIAKDGTMYLPQRRGSHRRRFELQKDL